MATYTLQINTVFLFYLYTKNLLFIGYVSLFSWNKSQQWKSMSYLFVNFDTTPTLKCVCHSQNIAVYMSVLTDQRFFWIWKHDVYYVQVLMYFFFFQQLLFQFDPTNSWCPTLHFSCSRSLIVSLRYNYDTIGKKRLLELVFNADFNHILSFSLAGSNQHCHQHLVLLSGFTGFGSSQPSNWSRDCSCGTYQAYSALYFMNSVPVVVVKLNV